MDAFGSQEIGVLLFAGWLFVSVTTLPRFVENLGTLSVVILVAGAAILFGFDAVAPRSPLYVAFSGLVLILATLMAIFHSELLFRRRSGYWRFVGRPSTE
ncbi:MAG: hypothetical protein KF738_14945 [Burkholderiales bacterium]|nr:hypothetical protein [Burkholderiales bacterium]